MKKKRIREIAEEITEAVVLATVLFFLCWPLKIEGSSMENTFKTGNRVTISRIMRFKMFLKNGDIIFCKLGEEKDVIKRIIATPGQHIVIKDNAVYIDEKKIDEPYLKHQKTRGNIDITLAEDEYFIMGDNRSLSLDSRTEGTIKKDDIMGKVIFRWYPFNEIEWLY